MTLLAKVKALSRPCMAAHFKTQAILDRPPMQTGGALMCISRKRLAKEQVITKN